jgi:YidC/Oxa1 family membrane protein insertase
MQIIITPIKWVLESLNSLLSGIGIPYSFGFAIILFTLAIKLVTAPLNAKQIRSSKAMQDLQPKLKEMEKKYKDKDERAKKQMEMYKEAGINPLGGCLPTLIQFPIWIGLYQSLYQLAKAGSLNERFFWLPSLADPKNMTWVTSFPGFGDMTALGAWAGTFATFIILPVLTVVTQILMQKMMTPTNPDAQTGMLNSSMMLMPFMFGFFALQVPSGLALYWVVMNVFSMVQQYMTTGWGGLARKTATVPEVIEGSTVQADGRKTSGNKKRKH